MLRIISDVHGKIGQYIEITEGCDYSLQIGDMGYDYSRLDKVDPDRHKFFEGNHGHYPTLNQQPHNLGDFGLRNLGGEEFFFIRGAFSIDKKYRIEGVDWFQQEQLNRQQQEQCIKEYEIAKPDVVISHTCPSEVAKIIGNPMVLHSFGFSPERFNTETQALLQDLFEIHKPKLWIFGHFHMNIDIQYRGTRFICKPELGFTDIENGKVVQ